MYLIHDIFKPVRFLTENYILLFAIVYIVITALLQFSGSYYFALITGLMMLMIFMLFDQRFLTAIITISAVLLSLTTTYFHRENIQRNRTEFDSLLENIDLYEMLIISDPQLGHFSTDYPVEVISNNNSARFLIRTERFPRYLIGDRCVIKDREVEKKELSENYSAYLMRNGYAGIVEAEEVGCVSRSISRLMVRLRRSIYSLKVSSAKYINSMLLEPKASLLMGMIYGDDRLFSEEFEEDLRVTGTTHIIAASGFNVTILFLMVERLVGGIIPLKMRVSLTIFLVFLFAFSANLSGSILRATITMLLVLISKVWGRVVSIAEALIISVFLIVLFWPGRIADLGLLLSSAAMIGIIIVMPLLSDLADKLLGSYRSINIYLEENLFSTLSCTVGTLPISNIFFGTGSLISVLPNLFLLPFVEYIYYLGVSILIFSFLDIQIIVGSILPALELFLGVFIEIIRLSSDLIEQIDWITGKENIFLGVSAFMLFVGYLYVLRKSRFVNYLTG